VSVQEQVKDVHMLNPKDQNKVRALEVWCHILKKWKVLKKLKKALKKLEVLGAQC